MSNRQQRPGNTGSAEIMFVRAKWQLVNRGKIEHLPDGIVARRRIGGAAEGIQRRVGFAAADAAAVNGMRPHVVGRKQEAGLKGPANVQLQRMEGAVTHVPPP